MRGFVGGVSTDGVGRHEHGVDVLTLAIHSCPFEPPFDDQLVGAFCGIPVVVSLATKLVSLHPSISVTRNGISSTFVVTFLDIVVTIPEKTQYSTDERSKIVSPAHCFWLNIYTPVKKLSTQS